MKYKLPTVEWMCDRYALTSPTYVNPRIYHDKKTKSHLFVCDIVRNVKKIGTLCPILIDSKLRERYAKAVRESEEK